MHFHHDHIQTLSMDQCAYRSRLRSWNPAWKLVFVLAVILFNLMAEQVSVAVFTVLFMGLLSVAGGRIPLSDYLHALKVPLAFILLGSIAVGLGIGDVPPGAFAVSLCRTHFFLTSQGMRRMLLVIMRALAAVSAMYLVTLSTPAGEFMAALKKLPLPSLLFELMHLIYRYIFILLEAQQRMRQAAESRLGFVDFRASCKSFGAVMGNLLVVSLKKSRSCFDAMESRCYDMGGLFYQEKRPVSAAQILCMLAYFLLAACLKG